MAGLETRNGQGTETGARLPDAGTPMAMEIPDAERKPIEEDVAKLPSEVVEVLDEVSEPAKRKILFAIKAMSMQSGPLPSPETIGKYEDALPGLGNRIVQWAERQLEHRVKTEVIMVTGAERRMRWSQINSLVMALAGLALAAYLGQNGGNPWVAATIAIVAVGGPGAATALSRTLGRNPPVKQSSAEPRPPKDEPPG